MTPERASTLPHCRSGSVVSRWPTSPPLLGGMQQRRSAKPGKEAGHANPSAHPSPAGSSSKDKRGLRQGSRLMRIFFGKSPHETPSGVGNSISIHPSSLLKSFLIPQRSHLVSRTDCCMTRPSRHPYKRKARKTPKSEKRPSLALYLVHNPKTNKQKQPKETKRRKEKILEPENKPIIG